MDFNVQYFNFMRKLIPWFLRQTRILAFVQSFSKAIQNVNDDFNEFRDDIRFKLAFNAQIIYLEQYLNTVYPSGLIYPNNIQIVDGSNIEFDYFYNFSENQPPVYLYNYGENADPIFFRNYSEQQSSGSGSASYVIKVPTAVQSGVDIDGIPYNEIKLKKRVNFYNNAGKTYLIEYF